MERITLEEYRQGVDYTYTLLDQAVGESNLRGIRFLHEVLRRAEVENPDYHQQYFENH